MALRIGASDVSKVREALLAAGIPVQTYEGNKKQRVAFDLLATVEYGGCSAKLSPIRLDEVLKDLPQNEDPRLLVGLSTHDDAGVWRISDTLALIQTTDFFPPICSDPYDFGQIAAANALSDVYAMGGTPVTALNLVMFPAEGIPLDVLRAILWGGQDQVTEAGAAIVGGHTIADSPPKYGLAVTGTVHPDKIVTNSAAHPGNQLILTKPLGTGTIVAGQRIGEVNSSDYENVIQSMQQLNKGGAEVMQRFDIRSATDITGFGLLGHALEMARASHCTLQIHAAEVPMFPGAYALIELGCIPGAAFRNQAFVESDCFIAPEVDYNRKILLLDPQTSGGLLMSVPKEQTLPVLAALQDAGYPDSAVIGEVVPDSKWKLIVH